MKVVILAGGYGTRFSEESQLKPKPMIEIGGKPILWHIMKCYSHYGFYDFVICAGYKQHMVKDWFSDYFLHNSDVTFDFTKGSRDVTIHDHFYEPWKVTVVDTGLNTMTGGRIKRIQSYIGEEPFMDIGGDNTVRSFREKNKNDGVLINAGYMVFQPEIFSYLDGDQTVFEREPFERLASEGQLMSYTHKGFWQCMDNVRERDMLEKMITEKKAPWMKWKE